jgi:diaminopimelate epimerase
MEGNVNGAYRVTIADAAGNTTALVSDAAAAERTVIARRLLAETPEGELAPPEQVGFVVPPLTADGFWRLEMAGGEFCGNAARSFALFLAKKTEFHGTMGVIIEISGCPSPLTAIVNTETCEAEVEMPLPLAMSTISYDKNDFPVIIFEGITHIIVEDVDKSTLPDELCKIFFELKAIFDKTETTAALGLMFYDRPNNFLRPAVYVYGTDSFVFESSCGSGSAALAYYLSLNLPDGEHGFTFDEPGGVISSRIK